jgi:hypothetical protein
VRTSHQRNNLKNRDWKTSVQREQFLTLVRDYIKSDPEAAAYVSDNVAAGLNESRKEAMERAADMEVALSVMIAQRYKGREALVLGKLRKWNGKSSLRWDETINDLASR